MKMPLLALALCLGAATTSQAGGLSKDCREAASQGGPCGCVASEHIFGESRRDLWAVSDWRRFPRAAPAAGMAAIWGNRHVEAVVSNNGDGTVTTDGPYGKRRVSVNSVSFVDPHGAGQPLDITPSHYAARTRVAARAPVRHRYAANRYGRRAVAHYAHAHYHHRHYASRSWRQG